MLNKLLRAWCRFAHDALMHPHHGITECRTCQRRYPVAWEQSKVVSEEAAKPVLAEVRQ